MKIQVISDFTYCDKKLLKGDIFEMNKFDANAFISLGLAIEFTEPEKPAKTKKK